MGKNDPDQVKIAREKLAKAGIPETEEALLGFDVYLDLEAVGATTTVSPVGTAPALSPPRQLRRHRFPSFRYRPTIVTRTSRTSHETRVASHTDPGPGLELYA